MSLAELAALPGLDVEAGLSSVAGREQAYLRLLGMLFEQHADDLASLRVACTSGDVEVARRIAHSLKGACATLGALRVSEAARAVEMLVKQRAALSELTAAIDGLDAEYFGLQAGVRACLRVEKAPAAQAVSDQAVLPLLSQLQVYLQEDDFRAAAWWREHAAQIEPCLGAVAPEIRQAIEKYDFSSALRRLREVGGAIGLT